MQENAPIFQIFPRVGTPRTPLAERAFGTQRPLPRTPPPLQQNVDPPLGATATLLPQVPVRLWLRSLGLGPFWQYYEKSVSFHNSEKLKRAQAKAKWPRPPVGGPKIRFAFHVPETWNAFQPQFCVPRKPTPLHSPYLKYGIVGNFTGQCTRVTHWHWRPQLQFT